MEAPLRFWVNRPTGSNPFHASRGPLAAILPLFPRRVRVQLPIPKPGPRSPLLAVGTPGTTLRHDGLAVLSPVAAISLPHRQIGTS